MFFISIYERFYCGLGVHKEFTYATLIDRKIEVLTQNRMSNDEPPEFLKPYENWESGHGGLHIHRNLALEAIWVMLQSTLLSTPIWLFAVLLHWGVYEPKNAQTYTRRALYNTLYPQTPHHTTRKQSLKAPWSPPRTMCLPPVEYVSIRPLALPPTLAPTDGRRAHKSDIYRERIN